MDGKMTLEQVRDWHTNCAVVYERSGESSLADQHRNLAAAITAHLTQPAQSVDVEAACVSMYPDWHKYHQHERETFRKEMKQAITRAIGNAQAEGWTRAAAKLHERKTVHEWLNDMHIEREEFGKPLCLLRRLRILCDRYADTCEQLSFEICKQAGWISTAVSQPERNAMVIYWHPSENGGFLAIADEWRDEHHLACASHWLPHTPPTQATPQCP